jgi:hypothetical protein
MPAGASRLSGADVIKRPLRHDLQALKTVTSKSASTTTPSAPRLLLSWIKRPMSEESERRRRQLGGDADRMGLVSSP